MTTLKPFVLLVCVAVAGCGRGTDEASRPPTASHPVENEGSAHPDPHTVTVDAEMRRDLRITTARVEARPGGEQVSLLGELTVDQRAYAEVGVPVAARVAKVPVNAGDDVGGGAILAEMISPELGKARADYLSAAARVTMAGAALERKRGLAVEKIVPAREVQEAESQATEARAALRAARAALDAFGVSPPTGEEAEGVSSTFVLRSPVRGTVIERAAVVGQMLEPAVPAFRIADLSVLWLTVHAFERDAVRIEAGVRARLAFPALPGREFAGTVAVVGRQVERESRTLPVRIDVRNAGGVLRPGMSGTAAVAVGGSGEPVLTVPLAAVQRVRNEWCVFLPKGAGAFEIRPIGRGRDLVADVEVLSGVRLGETVVVEGAFLLKAHAEKGAGGHDEH
jgi:cobalt-zinc-cadmium efflux system membrane fusion protein